MIDRERVFGGAIRRWARPHAVTAVVFMIAFASSALAGPQEIRDGIGAWVLWQYRLLLQREPDPSEILIHSQAVLMGESLVTQSQSFIYSPEYATKLLQSLYQSAFHRPVDPIGQAAYVPELTAGTASPQDILATLLASSEFSSAHPSNQSFAVGCYEATFGRDPKNGEESGWVSQLNANVTSRAAMASLFAHSDEATIGFIRGTIVQTLWRLADPSEVDYWLPRLKSGAIPSLGFVAAMASSLENYQRFTGNAPLPIYNAVTGYWHDVEGIPFSLFVIISSDLRLKTDGTYDAIVDEGSGASCTGNYTFDPSQSDQLYLSQGTYCSLGYGYPTVHPYGFNGNYFTYVTLPFDQSHPGTYATWNRRSAF